jgi:carbonic anhydrase
LAATSSFAVFAWEFVSRREDYFFVWLWRGIMKKEMNVGAAEAQALLEEGNSRFAEGRSLHAHADGARRRQSVSEGQGGIAYATILGCSDSRVPVEVIFDAGIIDLFVVRVAGNVVNGDEAGSIEYGLAHVGTPLLVVLGHNDCGAVTAVLQAVKGQAHGVERNIPNLLRRIEPAVARAMAACPDADMETLLARAVEENIWQAIEDLFMVSPVTRDLVKSGRAKVVGAHYDLASGRVEWLPEARVAEILARVEVAPERATEAMA